MRSIGGVPGTDRSAAWPPPLPRHWPRVPLRFLVTFVSGGTPDKANAGYWAGDVPWVSPKDVKRDVIFDSEDHLSREAVEESGLPVLSPGHVLMVVRGMILAHTLPVALNATEVTMNQDMKALRCSEKLDSRYLQAVLQGASSWILSQADESSHGTKKLDTELLGRFTVPCPSLEEQRAIVSRLQRETTELDSLVAAKERLLALLVEKRRAVISQGGVGRGRLQPELRETGSPWIPPIPKSWGISRLKFLAQVRGGLALGKKYGDEALIERPYLRVANVKDGYVDLRDLATVTVPASEADACLLKPGDVLMTEGGDADKLGRGCVWQGQVDPCLHQNHVFAVRARHDVRIDPEFLSLWTSGEPAKAYLESRAKQSTNLASISATNIEELPVPVPPVAEQRAIVDLVTRKTAEIDGLTLKTQRSMALLKERRAALITAAITGQIDVTATAHYTGAETGGNQGGDAS